MADTIFVFLLTVGVLAGSVAALLSGYVHRVQVAVAMWLLRRRLAQAATAFGDFQTSVEDATAAMRRFAAAFDPLNPNGDPVKH